MNDNLKEKIKELSALNATKDKFFTIIAHDLRAPFNALIGFSNLLIEEVSQSTDKELYQYSSVLNESLNKTYDYLNNLLEWSRLQTNKIEFTPSFFSLSDLLYEVKDILKVQAQNKEININTNLDKKIQLYADRNMIKIVLINLLSNAIKYSNINSSINVSCNHNNKYQKIFVEDNGVGMTKESCLKLFKVEESFSTPGTYNEKGTGLGLVLCNDFVKKHNGQIDVKSKIGKGSIFCISLPAYERKI